MLIKDLGLSHMVCKWECYLLLVQIALKYIDLRALHRICMWYCRHMVKFGKIQTLYFCLCDGYKHRSNTNSKRALSSKTEMPLKRNWSAKQVLEHHSTDQQ